jgi:hydroxyethylthiazole kinase-like uncharacterized protein yjeF
MKILLNAWMQRVDRAASERGGIPSIVLMENAAGAAAAFFSEEFPASRYPECLIMAGKGNNGGDGLAIGRHLLERGYEVRVLLLAAPDQLSPDAKCNHERLLEIGCLPEVIASAAQLKKILSDCHAGETFLVDAIFGTGLSKPLSPGLYAEAIEAVNRSAIPVAAVDVPSGLSENFSPEAGPHIRARVTAALHSLKWSHLVPDGCPDCGRIRVLDIGIPRELENDEDFYIRLTEPADFKILLARRPREAHKGAFGHILAVVGSEEKPGAGILASYSALKAGAGLATAAVSLRNRDLYVLAHPEVMTLPFEKPEELSNKWNDFSCVLAGPGMGDRPSTLKAVSFMLKGARVPLIFDADAINVLWDRGELLKGRRSCPLVLTPHPGEFARLIGKTVKEVQENRLSLAREFAQKYRLYLVLKGHHTLTATPDGRIWVNQTGNPGMATAGSGDVLSGMIAGFVAQFYPKYPLGMILAAAVFLHGYAGDLAAHQVGEMGLTAGDIIAFIPKSILKINGFRSPFLGA